MGALEKVAADIAARQVEAVFNLGDILSGPLYPKETLEFLKEQNWTHIAGNHDRLMVTELPERQGLSNRYALGCLCAQDLDWLRNCPSTSLVEERLFIFHGTPANDTEYLLETVESGHARLATPAEIAQRLAGTVYPLMLCGHTHVPRVVELPGNILVVNPGSVGLQAYDDAIPEPHVMETGSPHARYAVLEEKEGRWQVDLIAVAYDHEQAARQARQNGRRDWEVALRTGYAPATRDG